MRALPNTLRAWPPFIKGAVLVFVVSAVVLRVAVFLAQEESRSLAAFVGQPAVVSGTVVGDPERRARSLRAAIEAGELNGQPAAGKFIAVLPRDTELSHGDKVVVRGVLESPEAFKTDTGRVFDYPGYLRVRGISALMPFAVLGSREEGGPSLLRTLYAGKHAFMESLERLLPEPRGALMEGILLGERRALPDALTQAFIVAGLIHVVVLSGYNIAVVAEAVLRLFGALMPRRSALALGAMAILCFALVAGAGAATVRACLMGLIAILARYLRRPALALRSLFVAAGAMVLWNPLVLLYDPGFLLSVLATFGLITLSPYIERRLGLVPAWEWLNIRAIAASTIAVQLFLLPALLYMSGFVSPYALLANVIVLPLIPLAMLLGFGAGALGLISPMLGLAPAYAADILLRLVVAAAEGAAHLPFAAVAVAPFPVWMVLAAYALYIPIAVRLYRQSASPAPAS